MFFSVRFWRRLVIGKEAKEVLENYCTQSEDNPNAFRHLYRFLKRNNGTRQEMIQALKVAFYCLIQRHSNTVMYNNTMSHNTFCNLCKPNFKNNYVAQWFVRWSLKIKMGAHSAFIAVFQDGEIQDGELICINSIFLVCSYFILFTIHLSVKCCEM